MKRTYVWTDRRTGRQLAAVVLFDAVLLPFARLNIDVAVKKVTGCPYAYMAFTETSEPIIVGSFDVTLKRKAELRTLCLLDANLPLISKGRPI